MPGGSAEEECLGLGDASWGFSDQYVDIVYVCTDIHIYIYNYIQYIYIHTYTQQYDVMGKIISMTISPSLYVISWFQRNPPETGTIEQDMFGIRSEH